MTTVKEDKGEYPDHIYSLLDLALRTLKPDLDAVGADPRRQAQIRGLRSSQLRLVSLTPVDGLRLTDLAARVGMTKQALGEFATELEDRGLLETVRDPSDKRLRILRRTELGNEVAELTQRAIEDMESRWRGKIGAARWDAMREGLLAIAQTDVGSMGGLPARR